MTLDELESVAKNGEDSSLRFKTVGDLPEVGAERPEVGAIIDFDALMPNSRKDFKLTCRRVWEALVSDRASSQRAIPATLGISNSSVAKAYSKLKELGLLVNVGGAKSKEWNIRDRI